MSEAPEILFEVRGKAGWITLNRPAALNALTLNMIRLMDAQMKRWATDPAVAFVVITGAGEKAFCAGGDVKAVALDSRALRDGTGAGDLAADFFREEYILNHRIHSYPKPYVALINGIVMGGGKGVSAHGTYRVVTENILFAMPETNIGFFPDVGGGYFLPRCPGQTGVYLAMTSQRIKAGDTAYIGFATHFVPAQKFTQLQDALVNVQNVDDLSRVLASFAEPAPESAILSHNRAAIDRCFGFDRVEDIVAALKNEKTAFADETLKAMAGMSPTSLKVALKQIRLGARLPFAEVMTMEYRISQSLMRAPDFYEGIRAALIDKDRQPKWNPAEVSAVNDDDISRHFQPLGQKDLSF